MHIAEIWRYPVKSMGGQQLQAARLTPLGIEGDRVIQARNAGNRMVTARTHPGLLGFHSLIESGNVLIDGRPWNDPEILDAVTKVVGPGGRLAYYEGAERFDILPLLVATDGAIAAFGRDSRRLRPNIVIGGVKGLEEREWEGDELLVGDQVRIQIVDLRGRCVMTTYDPDTLKQDSNVLRDIVRRFGGELALNCSVIEGGEIEVGQEVTLIKR